MKKKYIIPQMTMVTFAGETFCEGFNGASGLKTTQIKAITVELVPRKTTSLLGITISMRRKILNLISRASRSGIK